MNHCYDDDVQPEPADRSPSGLVCEVCGHFGPLGEVDYYLEDGEQGTYVLLCCDRVACDARLLSQQTADYAEMGEPLPVYSEEELPF